MRILYGSNLSESIKNMLKDGGVIVLVSPYISDFNPWRKNSKGKRIKEKGYHLTESLVMGSLEEDGRIIIITDENSKIRKYSKVIIDEIVEREDTFWIYLFEIDKLHAKLYFKSKEAIIGSANLTYPAIKRNLELGVHLTYEEEREMFGIRNFIGGLIIQSKPLNKQSNLLIKNFKKQNLFKEKIIFDVLELIAYSHYLHRTTKIHCIWNKFDEPKILKKLSKILNKFDNITKDTDEDLPKFYSPINDDVLDKGKIRKYFQMELKIKERKIKDVINLWRRYLSGQINRPILIWKYLPRYSNPIKLPKIIKAERFIIGSVN